MSAQNPPTTPTNPADPRNPPPVNCEVPIEPALDDLEAQPTGDADE